MRQPYLRILTPDAESETYAAEILEFPGCIAEGSSPEEAYQRLEKSAESWIEAAVDLGQSIPQPLSAKGFGGRVALRLPKSLHRQVALAAIRDGVSLNQFLVAAVAEKVGAASSKGKK